MKRIYTLLLAGLSTLGFTQSQDLAKLANGKLKNFTAVYDQKQSVYGYVGIYDYGKTADDKVKFEYVFLDKNLNPVANKEFTGERQVDGYTPYLDFRNKIILTPTMGTFGLAAVMHSSRITYPRTKEIDIQKNSITDKDYFEYDEGVFKLTDYSKTAKAERAEDRSERKSKGYNYRSGVYEIKEGGFLVVEYKDYGSYSNGNNLIRFDENKKEVWRFSYNTNGDKKVKEYFSLLDKDENKIFGILQNVNNKVNTFQLLVLDMKTGKVLHQSKITGLNDTTLDNITRFQTYSYGTIDNSKSFDDKIVLVGRNLTDKSRYAGFARLMVDKNTYKVDAKTITYESLKSFIPKLSDDGGVEKGYFLDPRDIFILKNGSVGVLLEKYKPAGQYSSQKTTDMVYIFTDHNFKPGVKIFDKEKTRFSTTDYLFSQYINDGNDVVFFFRDYVKDNETRKKQWNLFINSVVDNQFKQETIQISSKGDYFMLPYVAKDGYILFQESNEKDKYNQVRLERLNF